MLTTEVWLRRYETGLHNLVEDFYVPALSRSVQYDRKAGFFSSSALAVAATGIARLLANGGRMRLLVGVRLSSDDTDAMAEGYRQRQEVIEEALTREWVFTDDSIARDRLGALAEMIAQGLLEIRIVAPTDEDGVPLCGQDVETIFHEKAGILTDAEGNRLVFVGSINESQNAWKRNLEHFSVFCSWRDDAPHAEVHIEDFERLWAGEHPLALTLPFPDALRQGLLEYRPDEPPEYDPLEVATLAADTIQTEREKWLFQFLRDAPLLSNGDALVEELCSVPPWPHQRLVRQETCADYSHRWHMLCDEVGLGKTIEAGLVLRTLLLRRQVRRVLILAPKNLIKQWQQELREKFNLTAHWYTGQALIDPLGNKQPIGNGGWNSDFGIIIASEQLAKRHGRMESLLAADEWDLVMVDEAHHARRSWGTGDGRRNRLLRLLDELRKKTKALLLMTATPMQVDVGELWDLLRLTGMQGIWASSQGTDFRQYFLTLHRSEWSRSDVSMLLRMTQEYFAEGGAADEELRQSFRRQPGGFNLWSQLTSSLGTADPAAIEERMRSGPLRPLLQEFFRRHTPVRQFVFRHTRGTLRSYRAQGLLTANVPERDVKDVFIPLGSAQDLYDRIENYISDKYKRAEAEKRGALGYVMTIYRQRLTSSPWAISQTLQRQLEKRNTLAAEEGDFDEDADAALDDDQDDLLLDEHLDWPALWDEIAFLEQFIQDLKAIGPDPKLRHVVNDLRAFRANHPQVVIFTQYTDTMDFLRDTLVADFDSRVACYSGRGGEVWDEPRREWLRVKKDDIKSGFADGDYWALVCTEAASEGLNLQSADLLINYDMPWNPMRVEQRIGRIDRIGQTSPVVTVVNYYYDKSVEAEIYAALSARLNVFRTAVGPHQPVLGRIAKRIERAAMAGADERVEAIKTELEEMERDQELAQRDGVDVDGLAQAGVAAQPANEPPCRADDVRDTVLESKLVAARLVFREVEPGVYEMRDPSGHQGSTIVTFHQDVLDSRPETVDHCLAWGDDLFAGLLDSVPAPGGSEWGPIRRGASLSGGIAYEWVGDEGTRAILTVADFRECLRRLHTPPS